MSGPVRAGATPGGVPLLSVEDLAVEYTTERGVLRAVDGVSFTLAAGGEALGLIGESGSGKTSLTSAVTRLLPRNGRIAAGRIVLAGEEVGGLPDEEFRTRVRWSRIAVVVQGAMASLNPVIRIMDQGTERLRADGMRRAEAEARFGALLDRVGLPSGIGRRYPHELSGGMKQRTIIAMALTHDPELLVLDEPTSALDVSIQAQIMNLLKELKRELGIGMLFITHDLALASDLCDRVAVVYAGQIREIAETGALLADPRDPYAQRLLASIPRLHAPTPPGFLPGAPPDLRVPIAGCRFAARCPLVFERCRTDAPPLAEVGDGHGARCFLSADGPLPAVGA